MSAAPIACLSSDGPVVVASRLFGPLSVNPGSFITFLDGLPGFAGERRFILLPAAPEGVYWLQAVEEGSVAFLLVDPFPIFPGYEVELPDDDGAGAPPIVLSVVTLPREDEPSTANLQAPVLLDLERRMGWQAILADSGYGARHPFDLRTVLARAP